MTRQQGTSHALMRKRKRLERAGGKRLCAVCGRPVDMALRPPDPDSFELHHHEQPRSHGGTTVAIAHRRCNRARGNRGAPPPDDRSDYW